MDVLASTGFSGELEVFQAAHESFCRYFSPQPSYNAVAHRKKQAIPTCLGL